MTIPAAIPVAEGLFERVGADVRLIGSRCAGCGTHQFPKGLSCRNPSCSDKRLQDTPLSRHGTLYSYTLQAFRPPALYRMEPWSPYLLGLVELPEGLRVMGRLSGCTPEDLHIGMPMELTLQALHVDDAGRTVLTYAFRPRARQGATP